MNAREHARAQVVAVAEGMIGGRIGIIEGARTLVALGRALTDDSLDDDFITFVAIDSETDSLPMGEVRKLWAVDSRVAKDAQIDEVEILYRERAFDSCRKLLARFRQP